MISFFYVLVLVGLTVNGLYKLALVILYYRHRLRAARELPVPAELPRVTVQLPLYNEIYVVERLLTAVAALDYPRDRLEVQVLDDSTDETSAVVAQLCEAYAARGLRMRHLHRSHRNHFKAGALEAGVALAEGELVAIFDADFVPQPDFLLRTLGPFSDPRVGMVQARWSFLNEGHSFLTGVQSVFLNAHFIFEHGARFRSGCFFNFNGTAGVWRKSTIRDAGGWSGDTLTEDLDLSYRAQLKGWRFVYLPQVRVPSELPSDLASLKAQQFRWAKGMSQVALKLLGPIWRSSASTGTKLDATLHLISASGYVYTTAAAILAVPCLLLHSRREQDAWLYFCVFSLAVNLGWTIFYYVLAEWENRTLRPRRMLEILWMIPIGIGLSLNGARAVLEALIRRPSPFVRTPKFCLEGQARAPEAGRASRYRVPVEITPVLETACAGLYAAAMLCGTQGQNPRVVFPLALFGVGYFYLGAHAMKGLVIRGMERLR